MDTQVNDKEEKEVKPETAESTQAPASDISELQKDKSDESAMPKETDLAEQDKALKEEQESQGTAERPKVIEEKQRELEAEQKRLEEQPKQEEASLKETQVVKEDKDEAAKEVNKVESQEILKQKEQNKPEMMQIVEKSSQIQIREKSSLEETIEKSDLRKDLMFSFREPNMNFEEIFTCQICMMQYNFGRKGKSKDKGESAGSLTELDQSRKPLLIPCGHTFCSQCLKKMMQAPRRAIRGQARAARDSKNQCIECPLCKTEHQVPAQQSVEKAFPINYSIIKGLDAYTKEKKFGAYYKRYCPKHRAESLNFYCKTCKVLICQQCLIQDGHLSRGCQIDASQEMITKQIIEDECKNVVSQLEDHVLKLTLEKMKLMEERDNLSEDFKVMLAQIKLLIESEGQNAIVQHKLKKNKKITELETKISEYEVLCGELKRIQSIPTETSKDSEAQRAMMWQVRSQINDDEEEEQNQMQQQYVPSSGSNEDNPFEHSLFIPEHLSSYFMLAKNFVPTDPKLESMIQGFKREGQPKQKILNVFRAVDRKFFVLNELNKSLTDNPQAAMENARGESPYYDSPQQIGWNTTISAPGMHYSTLKYLGDRLVTAKNMLDIGTGSGFVSACMAELSSVDSKVFAVDHIAAINEFARFNISKICPHFIKREKIVFVTQDGRQGLDTYLGKKMLYDVIHVGGQLNEVDERAAARDSEEDSDDRPEGEDQSNQQVPFIRVHSQESQSHPVGSINDDSDDGGQPGGGRRNLRIDRKLLEQLAPGGLMWVPLSSTSEPQNNLGGLLNLRMQALFTHHEIYLISRKPLPDGASPDEVDDSHFTYKKLMDCRYAPLRSVEDQLNGA